MPRKRLSDSAKKRTKFIYNQRFYKLHHVPKPFILHLKIDLQQKRRWNLVKEKLNLNTDGEVLKVLLDSYCRIELLEETVSSQIFPIPSTSESNTAGTSTPMIKAHAFLGLPCLSELSSVHSSDTDPAQMSGVEMLGSEVEGEKSASPKDLNLTYDPHDITQDYYEIDVLFDDKDEEDNLGGLTYEDDINDPNFSSQQLNITYCDKTIDYELLPIIGEDEEDEQSDDEENDMVDEGITFADGMTDIKAEAILDEKQVICFSSNLMDLAAIEPPKTCRLCGSNTVTKSKTQGTGMKIMWICGNGHLVKSWSSQPHVNRILAGDFLLACNILISGNNYLKIKKLFEFMKLGFVTARTFYSIQTQYTCPTISKFWEQFQKKMLNDIRGKELILLGDGQNDSPGHCAQYLNYNIIDNETGHLIVCDVVDKRETNLNSNGMETVAFQRGLQFLLDDGQNVKEVVTDGHLVIKSYMAKEKPEIKHSNDIWHGAKSVTKKLSKVASKKENKVLLLWAKKIVNHFWYCAKSCMGNANKFKAIWQGLLHHVCDEHEWLLGNGFIEPRCQHGELDDDEPRQWLQKNSAALAALRQIICDKVLMKNIPYYVNFRHTGNIESFHSFKLMYASKRIAFSPPIYKARCLLAAIDFNVHKDRPNKVNQDGEIRMNRKFSKRANNWSVVPLKEAKKYEYVWQLHKLLIEARLNDVLPLKRKRDLESNDPRRLASTIANIPPLSTEEITKQQKSRF